MRMLERNYLKIPFSSSTLHGPLTMGLKVLTTPALISRNHPRPFLLSAHGNMWTPAPVTEVTEFIKKNYEFTLRSKRLIEIQCDFLLWYTLSIEYLPVNWPSWGEISCFISACRDNTAVKLVSEISDKELILTKHLCQAQLHLTYFTFLHSSVVTPVTVLDTFTWPSQPPLPLEYNQSRKYVLLCWYMPTYSNYSLNIWLINSWRF